MENKSNKLELRKEIKRKKPNFTRQCSIRKKVGTKWRRPKGLHSKMRYGMRGYKKSVEPGYGSPTEVKGLHISGLKMVLIKSLKDISLIDPKTQAIIISAKIGMRNVVHILNEAKKKSITVLNIKIEDYLKKVEDKLKARKEKKEEKTKKKEKKVTEKPKKEEKKEETTTAEEEKDQEKREKDKLLTKKDSM